MKLSNLQQKSVKPEEMQQMSCAGNLEKALPHQPMTTPFLVLMAQDSSVHKLVSLAICALTDAFLNHKVNQMVLIDYDGQRSWSIVVEGDPENSFSIATTIRCWGEDYSFPWMFYLPSICTL